MTTTESGDLALLRILSKHIEVTEKLLDHFAAHPTLRELRNYTFRLRWQVQTMIGEK
jgi:hypothetical protein